MNVETVALIVVLGLGTAWAVHFERRRRAALKAYWSRSYAGRAWREAFPDEPKDAIREFLYFVVDEFGFERSRALKLAPHDTVLGLYRACYPDSSASDAMELETLHRTLSAVNRTDTVSINWYDARSSWNVRVTRHMAPTHQGITDLELSLDQVARKHGGKADGWGCMQVDANGS